MHETIVGSSVIGPSTPETSFVSYELAWGHGCLEVFKLTSGCCLEYLRKWYIGMPSPDADPWCIDFVLMVAASLVLAIEQGLVKVRSN